MLLAIITLLLSAFALHSSVFYKPVIIIITKPNKIFNVFCFLIPKLLKWLNKPTEKEVTLYRNKMKLKHQQSELSITDQFAKYSKIQRQINAIDQQLEEMQSTKKSRNFKWDISLIYLLKVPFTLLLLIFSYYYRYTPAFYLNKNFDLFPFSGVIAYPNKEKNAVSIYFWALCCTSALKVMKFQ